MLATNEQAALVSSVNMRCENHGDDKVPACDINFQFDAPAKILNCFHKDLRKFLYGDSDDVPLRFGAILGSLAIKHEIPGYRVNVKWGDLADSINLDFSDVKVHKVKAEPKEGGTVGIALQMQCRPRKEVYGDLALILQKEVRLTLDPPTTAELRAIQKAEAEAKRKLEDGDGEQD